MVDRLADAINKIKTNERIGRFECSIYSTKLIKSLMDVLKAEGYISGYEEFNDRYARMLKVKLSNKINSIGVVKPHYSLSKNDIQKYEERYIPSKDFGILIISTSKGLVTNKQARESSIGGRLIAYVY
ncbi:30S ribosomal protein S8 [Candidatus Marsarchaeota archaeon]|nr:30S ribosomal protein S8 [Candidatus Marsarchaeota archaeon]MCL5404539.1 30S ribosomal protein S8 [Candidatus Marsarchaeota archaeon]